MDSQLDQEQKLSGNYVSQILALMHIGTGFLTHFQFFLEDAAKSS